MRPSPLSCLSAGLFLALGMTASSIAFAQGTSEFQAPPGGMGPPPVKQSILLNESVQADLGLSDKQKSQLSSLQASVGQKSREAFQMAQENGSDPQEFGQMMATLHREHQAALVRVLDKNQKARLAQIELQREGFLAAARSDMVAKLKLAPAQTKKIKTIVDEMRRDQARALPGMLAGLSPDSAPAAKSAPSSKTKKGTSKTRRPASGNNGGAVGDGGEGMGMGMDGDFAGGEMGPGGFFGGNFAAGGPPSGLPDFLKPENQAEFAKMIEAHKKIRDAASAKIGEVLTDEQKTAFEKLTGKPFDLATLQDGPAEAKAAPTAEPKAGDAMKKEETPKSQPKTKTKKANRD